MMSAHVEAFRNTPEAINNPQASQVLFKPYFAFSLDHTGLLFLSHTHQRVNTLDAMTDHKEQPPVTPDLETPETAETEDIISLTIHYHGEPIQLDFPSTATLSDLSSTISTDLFIPSENQKFLISPKPGLVRPPFKETHSTLPLSTLTTRKITLLGSTTQEITDTTTAIQALQAKQTARASAQRAGRSVKVSKARDWKRTSDNINYSFASIKPLAYLPRPEKSQRFLERLATDPGIKASMAKHKFSVGLLTEMNPAEHTTHESRTLGLNRNRGEVIELRLRTDAYDGYRDYKVIRKTLCHELAHNVWGDHDRNFWNLCREIEAEVDRGDWTRGGHSVGGEEFYNPEDEGMDEEADGGGWTGGEYVLGGGLGGRTIAQPAEVMSRRDVIAKAAEERIKKQKDLEPNKRDASPGSSGN